MRICIIIPALNEASNLSSLLPFLKTEIKQGDVIVVSDAGSSDATQDVCLNHDVHFFPSPLPGRGPQMNAAAAEYSNVDVYYFLHADTRPPRGFVGDIKQGILDGFPVGCYRFTFDSHHPLLAINAYFTRFKSLACRGGDQSLYVTKQVFDELKGFRSDMRIMEDYDFIERVWGCYPFRIIPRNITVSARKYRANNYFRVQIANLIVFRMYKKGAPQQAMIDRYRSLLKEV